MRRSLEALRLLVPALPLAGLLACASALGDGDRFYRGGDLVAAEAAYRGYLESGRASGDDEARARYRLGLIYALPGSELHDWQRASRTLATLIERGPRSAWARQAALLLELHEERERLAAELEASDDRVSALLGEVVELRQAAAEAGDAAEDRAARVEQLVAEISALERSIGQLGERLEAREKELERIKKIDLQTPP